MFRTCTIVQPWYLINNYEKLVTHSLISKLVRALNVLITLYELDARKDKTVHLLLPIEGLYG